MKFQKYMFGVEVDNQSVAKYVEDDDSIVLVLESEGEQVKGSEKKHFDNQQAFEDYLDSFISNEDGMQGEARGLKLLIDKFEINENRDSIYASRYESKRNTKRVNIAFYLDDDRERSLYDQLQDVDNKKQTILTALEDHFNS